LSTLAPLSQDKRLLAGVAGAVLLAALGGYGIARYTAATPVSEPKAGAEPAPADSVKLSPDAIRNAGIAVETLRAGGLGAEIIAQAVVSPSPTGEALVTARAGGAVVRILKRLGDPVRAGEVLAIVESRDAAGLAADRTSASARAELARRNLARERYLFEQKVSARVDLEKAEAEAAAASADARRAGVAANAARVTGDGRGVIVASPISGRITAMEADLGAYVQPEAELFRVADPVKVQIEAAISPADALRLAAGDRAIVELADGRTVAGRVRAVTPALDRETRAATAVLDVPGGILQPGLGVRVRLLPSGVVSGSALAVPEDAVQSLGGRDVVFVRTAQGFRARSITIGQRSAGRVEILSGLKPGETIATRNAFLLKAELGKGAGGED
jgi:cobalt-zinc-cadmium efflux system membrane fusion protein